MTRTEHETMDIVKMVGNILLGGCLALGVCCGFLFLASMAISVGWLKEEIAHHLTVAACAIGTAAGALCAILRCKSRTLLVGLCVSAVFFLLLISVGLILYDDMSLEHGGATLLCGSLCGGAAMGLLCGRSKKKTRRTGRERA